MYGHKGSYFLFKTVLDAFSTTGDCHVSFSTELIISQR